MNSERRCEGEFILKNYQYNQPVKRDEEKAATFNMVFATLLHDAVRPWVA